MGTYLLQCSGCHKWHPYESSPMIRDELWEQIGRGARILCLDCMEERLGRKVVPADFGMYDDCVHNREFMRDYYKETDHEKPET